MFGSHPMSILWAWLDWWRVKHWTVQKVNWQIAPCIALLCAVAVWALPSNLNLFGEYGLVHQTNGLLQILAGFFIASLAAIATFQRTELDEVMGGDPPKLPKSSGRPFEELTRRRFLCLLFGYLSGASIILYLCGAACMMSAQILHDWGHQNIDYRLILRVGFGFLYCFVLSHIIVTALVGLYFLVDRMHQVSVKTGFVGGTLPSRDGDDAPTTVAGSASTDGPRKQR